MNLKRRELLIGGICGIAALTTGCVTKRLYEDDIYSEKVSSVLISSDTKKIAVLSDDFHYIFDAPENIIKLLNSPLQKNVTAHFGTFYVDGSNNITGSLNIFTKTNPSDDDRKEAAAIGFKPESVGGPYLKSPEQLYLELNLKGKRYSAGKFSNYQNSHKLNEEYFVYVTAEQSNVKKLLKAPLTPITVAIDGTLILSAVVFWPISIPMLLTNSDLQRALR